MRDHKNRMRILRLIRLLGAALALVFCLAPHPGSAEPMEGESVETLPSVLSLDSAMGWALQHNPDLGVLRQQHGIAAAAIVIARTYPYNPIFYDRTTSATGPPLAGVTQAVPTQAGIFFQIELFHQARYRQEVAEAAITRTDWEIAVQELALAIRVARAFQGVVYRKEKLALVKETINLNQQVIDLVQNLVKAGKMRRADLIVAQTEINASRAQLSAAQSALSVAMTELHRSLGVAQVRANVEGSMDLPTLGMDFQALVDKANHMRADLHARQAALAEAEGQIKLATADRYGNPLIGPFYERDPTSVDYFGVQMSIPIPVFNIRTGEIQQRHATRQQVAYDIHRVEILIQQDIEAALDRLKNAQEGVKVYQQDVLPELRSGLDRLRTLLQQGETGVDALSIIDQQRKLLRSRDTYLDAQLELSQAQIDLAAAIADPLVLLPPMANCAVAPLLPKP